MRELDIRNSLNHKVRSLFSEDQGTIIINEFGICQGEARIDLAVINGSIHGFEIKSENDTLERLPVQQELYGKVFDTVTIVTGDKYIDKVLDCVPGWWGIIRACQVRKDIRLETIREYKKNPSIDAFSMVQLLWHSEALSILEEHKLADGLRSKPRRFIWSALAQNLPVEQLSTIVRETLKKRESLKRRDNSRVVSPQK